MKIPSFRFRVEDVVFLGDGTTMFVGVLLAGGVAITPSEAELIVDKVSLGVLRLISEGKPSVCGRSLLITCDRVDPDIKSGQGIVLHGV